MLDILQKELNQCDAFTTPLPSFFKDLVAINYFNIPDRMKAIIAISEITTLASQFKRNVKLPDDTSVPVNSISFCIAPSGAQKDSSLRLTRRVFKSSYDMVDRQRVALSIKTAIAEATQAGDSNPEEEQTYNAYLVPPSALFLKEVTPQGLTQYLNDISTGTLGAGLITNSEIADEFNTNPNFPDIIKLLSEAYDLGIIEASYTKGKEFRNAGVSGVAVSALFIGSHYMIMYNEALKAKFINSFMSKLGRRGSFAYIPEKIEEPTYTSGLEMIKTNKRLRDEAKTAATQLSTYVEDVTNFGISTAGKELELSEEADTLMMLLQRYDYEVATKHCASESADNLYIKHRYWRALKMAGALAILDKSNIVTATHFKQAISITEYFKQDMALFENDLLKEPYEIFADYMNSKAIDGKSTIGLHDLRKLKYIPTSGDPSKKMLELIHLAAAYDKEATYSVKENEIHYDAIVKTDTIGISFKPIDNSGIFKAIESGASPDEINKQKGFVASTANYGLEVGETTFSDLAVLLTKDMAYSPFRFKDGNRSKSNIVGGSKVIALDVDHSNVTAEECHFMLQDINHHIALSSDPNNHFKFRVLIELDSVVDVDPIIWRNFFLAVADDISINVDPLPQSQIFFSYSGRSVLSVTDCDPLPVRNYLMAAMEKAAQPSITNKTYTTSQKQALIDDELETFSGAFFAEMGEGSRKMIGAAKKAYHDLGMTKDETIALIHRINQYWTHQMPEERLNVSIIQQIQRW